MQEAKLQQLRASYRNGLVLRLSAIMRSYQEFESGDQLSGHTLLRELHMLAGSAGSFGFPSVSDLARTAEQHCEAVLLLHNDQTNAAHLRSELLRALQQLRDEATSICATPDPDEAVKDESEAFIENVPLVLLCEDDKSFAELVRLQLAYGGYRVMTFEHPRELEAMLPQLRPHAVLIDICFENQQDGGLDVARRLRKRMGADLPPLCFISRRSDFAAKLEAARIGVAGYFVKPIDFPSLLSRLDSFTAKRHSDPYRVLIVDDDIEMARFHGALLQASGMRCELAHDAKSAMSTLSGWHPDVILLDLHMPECNGADLALVIRQEDAYYSLPIIFLSSERDSDLQMLSRLQGGDDFLTKPVSSKHLVSIVHRRAERYRRLISLSSFDGLTGALKKTAFLDSLKRQMARAEREKHQFCLAAIAIDQLTEINEQYGYTVGEQLLKTLAKIMTDRFFVSDVIGRYENNALLCLFLDVNVASAMSELSKIQREFAEREHYTALGALRSTVSGGIANFPIIASSHALLRQALAGLEYAVQKGGNLICHSD